MTEPISSKILHFSLGPVQGFVAQARRTRDLWGGSFLLSYLSGQAMKAVLEGGGRIVFPTVHGPNRSPTDNLLAAILDPRGEKRPHIGSLPNRFKAEVPASFDPGRCRTAILDAWEKIAAAVWGKFLTEVAVKDGNGTPAIWNRQIKNFWEIVWVMGEAPADGSDNAWLDARKNWRDPVSLEPEGGDHCSVMHALQELSGWTRAQHGSAQARFWEALRGKVGKLDLRDDEQLSAVALVKRLFPKVAEEAIGWKVETRNWPSTAYMAAVPWLAELVKDRAAYDAASTYAAAIERSFNEGAYGERSTRIACLDKVDRRLAGLDGNAFHLAALANPRVTPLKPEADRSALCQELAALNRLVGHQASPFYALLLMDGDSLGALLRAHEAARISAALADFTRQVPDEVAAHNGVTVYAGGDDVLALFPARDALPAALKLEESYRAAFKGKGIEDATISAAIVYAHYKQPLATVLKTAHRQLDKIAKDQNGRASVAAAVLQSSGINIQWVASFASGAPGRLTELAEHFRQPKPPFSTGFLYGLRDLFGLWPGDAVRAGTAPEPPLDDDQLKSLLVAEAMNDRERSLEREEAERRVADLLPVIRYHRQRNGQTQAREALQPAGARLARFLAHPGDDA
ncbi:type III-B CRISPR-associated protein Cas10/Cmr2 [Candidatus Methylocalor cossyra]|uniref:CRISPR-associated protein, Cmr2 family n=1 Tax=Candidatus Methylocalor cossyra TaxID=3108543 RepID=A0ABP1C9W6_9GAMM